MTKENLAQPSGAKSGVMRKLKLGCAYGCGSIFGLCVLISLLGAIVGPPPEMEVEKYDEEVVKQEPKVEPQSAKLLPPTSFTAKKGSECGDGGKVTQTAYAVAEEGVLRKLPQAGPPSVPFIVAGKAIPAPLETSATVQELCRQGKWSEVRIVTLPGHQLQGWVPSAKLRKVPTRTNGRRIYVASDFAWPDGVGRDKAAIVKLANRIMEQRPECLAMDADNLIRDLGVKGGYMMPCFVGKDMLSFKFKPADANNGRSFAKVDPISEDHADQQCIAAVMLAINHPSTLNIRAMEFEDLGDGRTQSRISFSAKNSFGLELNHKAICDFEGKKMGNVRIGEDIGL